jgi:CBS domain-containing protein
MSRTIRDIMTTDCITLTPEDSIYEAAMKMKQNDIGFLPIVEGRALRGVCTDRDIVLRCVAEKRSESSPVKEIMTAECITCSPDTDIDEAARLMSDNQIRRLCVVENNQLVGVCAIVDLAVRDIYENEAAQALHEISEPSHSQSVTH